MRDDSEFPDCSRQLATEDWSSARAARRIATATEARGINSNGGNASERADGVNTRLLYRAIDPLMDVSESNDMEVANTLF